MFGYEEELQDEITKLKEENEKLKLRLSDVMNSKKCWVIRNDIGIIKRVTFSLTDEDKERYRKIKWYIDECDFF
jgi:transcriptional regulator of NAD metabolism